MGQAVRCHIGNDPDESVVLSRLAVWIAPEVWPPRQPGALIGPRQAWRASLMDEHRLANLVASAAVQQSRVPAWDASGLPPMSWQGVACLDLSSDGRHVAVGTVAPSGDPNVLLLGPDGKLVRSWAAGQRWIQDVVAARDGRTVLAMCTTPEGRADDAPAAFRCGEKAAKVGLTLGQHDYPWTMFFYGDHSNHCGIVLRPYSGGAVGVWRDNVSWVSGDPSMPEFQVHVPLPEHAVTVAMAATPNGETLVGSASQLGKTGEAQPNLFLLAPGEKVPRWSRAAKSHTVDAPKPAPGVYGMPRGKDGVQHEVPQEDVEVRAPLSLAVHADTNGALCLVACADYVGWQRWLHDPAEIGRRSVTRFLAGRPVVSVYTSDGKLVREFAQDSFDRPLWLDLRFLPGARADRSVPPSLDVARAGRRAAAARRRGCMLLVPAGHLERPCPTHPSARRRGGRGPVGRRRGGKLLERPHLPPHGRALARGTIAGRRRRGRPVLAGRCHRQPAPGRRFQRRRGTGF